MAYFLADYFSESVIVQVDLDLPLLYSAYSLTVSNVSNEHV